MVSSGDRESRRWRVREMESSGVKLQGPSPGSLLRSKSTRHERGCEAASEWLVKIKCQHCSPQNK